LHIYKGERKEDTKMNFKAREKSYTQREEFLLNIGAALSSETNLHKLFEMVLKAACEMTGADAGTIYSVTPEHKLKFEVLLNESLKLHYGGTSKDPIPFGDIPLVDPQGIEDLHLTVTYAVNKREIVVIENVYTEKGFDFSYTKNFDEKTGYHTQAVLVIPMINHEEEIIGLLQLINPIHPGTNEIVSFTEEDLRLARALASQAAVTLSNRRLISDLRALFHSFVHVITEAIDEKSPATYGHAQRVPILTMLLANALNKHKEGPLADKNLTDDQLEELHLAALLHDCGKISTPSSILEKKSKLEATIDRKELIELRFALLEKELESAFLKETITEKQWLDEREELRTGLQKIFQVAAGKPAGEWSEEFKRLAQKQVLIHGKMSPLITPDEMQQLLIPKGNLTDKERAIMERHVVLTHKMLKQLSYPKSLAQLPEIASTHHERMNGKGYPDGLKGEQIPFGGRIIAIADVFEALSAPDRSYKEPWKLSKVLDVMSEMAASGDFDQELFNVFLSEKVYEEYAKNHLKPFQIDI
jgi:HD-GYP domain-containing protein (c-di-GMP phosphodiesterase class II)